MLKSAITDRLSQKLELSREEIDFLQSLVDKPYDFMDHPDYEKKSRFVDPIPDIKPDTSWFDRLIVTYTTGTELNKIDLARQYLLLPVEERDLFILYNWYRRSIRKFQDRWKAKGMPSLTTGQVHRLLRLRQLVLDMEARIASFNLGLIVAMAKRFRVFDGHNMSSDYLAEYSTFWSDNSLALLHSIRKFKASFGFKFSTYACRSMHKAMWKSCQVRAKTASREVAITTLMRGEDDDWGTRFDPVSIDRTGPINITRERLLIVQSIINRSSSLDLPEGLALTDDERFCLIHRFADSDQLPTLEHIALLLGNKKQRTYAKERIRQLIESGLSKLRVIVTTLEKPLDERDDFESEIDLDPAYLDTGKILEVA